MTEYEGNFNFATSSMVDKIGRVFFKNEKVYRVIYNENYAQLYQDILQTNWINELFSIGLIKTQVCKQISSDGGELILEHEKIPFFLSPQEFSNDMFYSAVVQMMKINQLLAMQGFLLKDCHPYNFTFHLGRPVFFDFASIVKEQDTHENWIDEFVKYCAIPVALASSKRFHHLSIEYRREHLIGFGKLMLEYKILRKYLLGKLLQIYDKKKSTGYKLKLALDWLEKHKPIKSKEEYWSHYDQYHDNSDVLKPLSTKQKFVFDILSLNKPSKVVDLAANKGFYSEMSARLGASVMAFDYEEQLVNELTIMSKRKKLDITPAILNFVHPSPASGWGLLLKDSFTRLKSEIVLALGLVHHICIRQKVPVELFCEICLQYASKGVVLEYVDPSDKFVSKWKESVPQEYCLENIKNIFKVKFPLSTISEPMLENGINRRFIYFYK